ncbi:uncharacterized protein EAF01_004929 [Botrytis porri]|uniref:Alcohol acetyltransferase n=1 Tax=Botrytis porri TaxID=87229 RepID=A0A4Z1K5I1_9HELO|nr:uncharacterized protein EAF01_004929 [Botrytis porri]KAF7907342.1 hypothetical protein EAF01_004929 [Botrytis porri]TGO81401.1 hypothetical protein BPOR_1171g00030 [Botrytis porri]
MTSWDTGAGLEMDIPFRELGTLERFYIARNNLKFFNSSTVTAIYQLPASLSKQSLLNLPYFKALIYKSVALTILAHPFLSVSIEGESSANPRWIHLSRINLSKVVQFVHVNPENGIETFIEEGLQRGFENEAEGKGPLWRVFMASPGFTDETNRATAPGDQDIINLAVGFFFHHAICDGLSGASFHKTFQSHLNSLLASATLSDFGSKCVDPTTIETLLEVPRQLLPPNMEEAINLTTSISFLLRRLFLAVLYPTDRLKWTGPLIPQNIPPRRLARIKSFSLDSEVTEKLVTRCRKEKTTITALTTVLLARESAQIFATEKSSRFEVPIAISMRRFAVAHSGVTDDTIGVYVSAAKPIFSCENPTPRGYISCCSPSSPGLEGSDEQLWDSARETRQYIATATNSPADQDIGALKLVRDFQNYFTGLLGGKRQSAFLLTNLGVVEGTSGDRDLTAKATLSKLFFANMPSMYDGPLLLAMATVKGGDMTLCLGSERGVIREDHVNIIRNNLEHRLRSIANE